MYVPTCLYNELYKGKNLNEHIKKRSTVHCIITGIK